jgi:MFS family permease
MEPQRDLIREKIAKRNKSLRYSIFDGSFYSIMDSFTSPFIVPYALFLNSSNIMISLIVSLPGLLGSIFQIAAVKTQEVFKTRKSIIVYGAFIQAIMWLPIMLIPLISTPKNSAIILLICVSLLSILGSFISTFWKGLMGDLVPEDQRGSYFSKRNLVIGIVAFVALYFAGYILQLVSLKNKLLAFAILFGVAFVARTFSAIFLSKMHDDNSEYKVEKHPIGLIKFIKRMPVDPYGRFVMFLCIFRIAIYIASPFFSVFMLKQLHLSYIEFTVLTSIEIFASLIFLRFWGHFNDETGSKNVLFITGFMIPFIPFLWTLNHNLYYIALLQFFSGSIYAGFNLATENFIYDATAPEERIRKVTYFNLLHGTAIFIGSIFGGYLLKFMSIMTLFLVSSFARFMVAFLLLPTLKEMRLIELNLGKNLARTHLYIKTRGGIHYETIASYTPSQRSEPIYPMRKSINPFINPFKYKAVKDLPGRIKLSASYDNRKQKPINKYLKNLDLFNKYRKMK